jgi:hypothetical protein
MHVNVMIRLVGKDLLSPNSETTAPKKIPCHSNIGPNAKMLQSGERGGDLFDLSIFERALWQVNKIPAYKFSMDG